MQYSYTSPCVAKDMAYDQQLLIQHSIVSTAKQNSCDSATLKSQVCPAIKPTEYAGEHASCKCVPAGAQFKEELMCMLTLRVVAVNPCSSTSGRLGSVKQ